MTRMRGSNSEVGHAWANSTHDAGQTDNGNLWFNGPTIYSYRTAIAARVDPSALSDEFVTHDGRAVFLVTSETFSKTTSSKHMPAVWRGIGYQTSDTRLTFYVPRVDFVGRGQVRGALEADCHAVNLAHLGRLARGVVERARTIRMGAHDASPATRWDDASYQGEPRFIEAAAASADEASRYAFAFGMDHGQGLDFAKPLHEACDRAKAIFALRLAEWNTPEAVAKRQKANANREANKARAAERKAAREAAKHAEAIAEFREGKRSALPYAIRPTSDLVRADGVTRDEAGGITGGELVTSQGVRVPLLEAIAIFKICASIRARGEPFDPAGRMRAGHFRVDRIASDGSFKAGCHSFRFEECRALAESLGVFETLANDMQEVGQ